MADNITTLKQDQAVSLDTGLFLFTHTFSFASDVADSGDTIELIGLDTPMRIFDAHMRVSATLGSSCTAKLQHYDGSTATDLTGASTAGQANNLRMTGAPMDVDPGDVVRVLIGGADVASAATVTVDIVAQRL